jgi:hypothetical protein
MKCCGGMKNCSMSTKIITIFLESRRYSSDVAFGIATTGKNIISQKQFINFCVKIFYDKKKHTSRTRTCNNSRYMSQPHFEGVVRSPLTLQKMGLGNPPGLPKIQCAIVGIKTPYIGMFFIPLERS